MSVTICRVVLPHKPLNLPSAEWRWVPLPFCLLGGEGQILRSGRALPHELPEAHRHEWILPAAAVTRLFVTESLLAGIPQTRWREALPNLLEPQVLWPLEECHCALAPAPDAQGWRVVAVMERAWMNFIHGAFSGRRGRLILSSSHDWAPIGCRGEWVFPVLDPAEEGSLRWWRDATGEGGGIRGRREEMGVLPWEEGLDLSPMTLMERLVLPTSAPSLLDLCQFEWAARGLARWGPAWKRALTAVGMAVLVAFVGLYLEWGRLAWSAHDLVGEEKRILAQRGLTDSAHGAVAEWVHAWVQRSQSSTQEGLQGEFPHLTGQLVTLLAQQPGLVPLGLVYRPHRLEVHFPVGVTMAAGLSEAASHQHLRWQSEGKGVWVLEEVQP
ncbi:GspL cytoplasmic actin-ATPase-like region [Ferrovum myxofaciens]|uniref:GspL cytoplasmic actin-ATPase-like region n=1 Tax=Ferrovum myxofaciens TaxID=416213 RepID=A0A149VYZ1_9PROT|nr:type II secretion system protein GspL [Ferrovum myxofaciens]KXW58440.1 GspL cytoplasmic actin-ATPase-like region [Ferrovum myxofaciens]